MLIIGELVNTSRKQVKENVELRNAQYIRNIAKSQVEAGADYLDVNCSNILDKELELISWLIENIQAVVDVPLCIDTPNPQAMEVGLSLARNGQPMANSITGEKERLESILPLIVKYRARVIGLCMDDRGMPETGQDRVRVALELVNKLVESGIDACDIYLDPLAKPVSTGDSAGLEVLDAIRLIKEECPGVHLVCAPSNVSYGLPNRRVLNRVFMIQTMAMGMDAYILDPLDRILMGCLYASQTLLGQDTFCMKYLATHRKGLYQQ